MRSAADSKTVARHAGVLFAITCVLAPARPGAAQEAASAIYVHSDSDKTTVISPRLRVAAPISDATRLQVVYGVDVWTSASVDIRASASKAVTEQRDEIDAQIAHDLGDVRLTGGYRYSTEPDYQSHAASLDAAFDFAEHNTTLDVGGYASFDHVGRVGDPGFWRPVNTIDGRVTLTQVLDTSTLVQALYEVSQAHGDLSSPYRFVAIGGSSPYCRDANTTASGAPAGDAGDNYCVPETNPERRMRHAAALSLRRAFGTSFSAGLSYRFYLDDWDLMSHTIRAELSWLADADTLLSLRYRFYLQNAAKQYQALYKTTDLEFYTNDKELSPLTAHRIGLELDHAWHTEPLVMHTVLAIAPSFYKYSDFVPLDRITAFEVTLAVVVQR
jgi:hypothetical protein